MDRYIVKEINNNQYVVWDSYRDTQVYLGETRYKDIAIRTCDRLNEIYNYWLNMSK